MDCITLGIFLLIYSDFKSTETQIFRGGLRHYTRHQERLILGQKGKPSDYHDKIDYERVKIRIKIRAASYTQDLHPINTSTSTSCLEDSKSTLLTDGSWTISTKNGSDWPGPQLWFTTSRDVTQWDNMTTLLTTSFISLIEIIKFNLNFIH